MSTVTTAPAHAALDGALELDRLTCTHGELRGIRVAYSVFGPEHAPPVVVLGGVSATRALLARDEARAGGWWPGVVGTATPLDPAAWRLIGIDYLGGRGDSSRPDYDGAWPALTTLDQARALQHVLDHLDVARAHAVVGASYGGMVALALGALAPERVERLILLCTAHRAHPLATAWRSIQRRIVRLGLESGSGAEAVGLARALAMTTYRSAAEFGQRFARTTTALQPPRFEVDDYLDHHAARYVADVPAESVLALSESLDLHDIDPTAVRARTTLVAFDSDVLVPIADVRALAGAIPRAEMHTVRTRFGHDGFLKETGAVTTILRRALAAAADVETASGNGTPAGGRVGESAASCIAQHAAHVPTTGAPRGAATLAARAGIGADAQHGAVIAPIHLSSTFAFEGLHGKRRYDYTRSGNPTRDTLAETIASLEHGAAGLVTATGMAAVTATLHLLQPGDLLLAAHDAYGGTHRLVTALARRGAFDLELADLTAPDAAALVRSRSPRMLWIETPSNPLLRITDIAALADAAHECGTLVVVDNTFLSPALQTPIDHGADLVVHSTTKYLNGHSDVVGGAVVARDAALAEEIGWWANCLGVTGSPFDSYLTQRGVRTLHARMAVHEANARRIVELLDGHEAVRTVRHPSLPGHAGHALACRQQRGFGAMASFELHGGTDAVARFLDGLEFFTLAESLGGVESLVAHPATMTHASMDEAARRTAGITDSMLRLSVGVEDVHDLTRDLTAALERARVRERPAPVG